MSNYLACCGLYCGACSSLLLKEKAEGNPDLSDFCCDYEEEPCSGCGSNGDCEFIRCCREHQVSNCAFCPEFPCAMITAFADEEWPHHKDVLDNLKRLREIGTEAWLAEQGKKWTCTSCGARIHWYQAQCRRCDNSWIAHYMLD